MLKKIFGKKTGFTLIELLVVVAILGVLAAIVVPNVGKFIGSGTVQAANTEVHNVQTAVTAFMADSSLPSVVGAGIAGTTLGPAADIIYTPAVGTPKNLSSYLTNPAQLQAVYTINPDGSILSAAGITDTRWKGLTFTAGVWK